MAVFSGAELGGGPPELGEIKGQPTAAVGSRIPQADAAGQRHVTFATQAEVRTYVVAPLAAGAPHTEVQAPRAGGHRADHNEAGETGRPEATRHACSRPEPAVPAKSRTGDRDTNTGTSLADIPQRARKLARQAEPGDQHVHTSGYAALLKLVGRRERQGLSPTEEQARQLLAATTRTEAGLQPGDVAVVPLHIAPEGPLVYVPSEPGCVLTQAVEQHQSTVERAEAAVRRWLGGTCFGYRCGTRQDKAKIVAVPVADGPPHTAVARTPAQRATKRSAGAIAVWCTLAALGGSSPIVRLAAASTAQFTTHDGSTTSLLREERWLREATGMKGGVGANEAQTTYTFEGRGTVTPRQLLPRSLSGMQQLRSELAANHRHLMSWADCLEPLVVDDVPEELWDKPLVVDATLTGVKLFAEPLPVYELPWLERQPAQVYQPTSAACGGFDVQGVTRRGLLTDEAQQRWDDWHRSSTIDNACLEERGGLCTRNDKPDNVVLGQSDTHECAYGFVWDCRAKATSSDEGEPECRLLDYESPMHTDFHIPWLREKLANYPDQRLASNILEGVRMEADLPYQAVAAPQLSSVGEGYQSLQATVRELRQQGFYEFHRHPPFHPLVVVASGSREKKLQAAGRPKKYRRTSNFSGPHGDVKDRDGVRVVSVNDASRCYYVPEWLAKSPNQATRQWAEEKYRHVPAQARATIKDKPRLKFPREYKPALGGVMGDMALLLAASVQLDEPVFVFVWDAAFYFNQFGYAPEELYKSTLVVAAKPGDVADDGRPFREGQLIYVAERRLGFGSYASSNIAQRFSNALVGWILEEFDSLEERALEQEPPDAGWRAWRRQRLPLEEECRRQRPKRKGQAPSDCTQVRLASIHMYTDDPVFTIVGVHRTARFLTAVETVVRNVGLQMAEEEKRRGGASVEWVGVMLLTAIGLVVVPKAKLLRAREALILTTQGRMQFGDYRALVGLLEHLRFIARLMSDSTNPLYAPHSRGGEGERGPNVLVAPTALMMGVLRKWITIILRCAGALVTAAFTESAAETLPSADEVFTGSADAAGDGAGSPGLGGYLHGWYWRVNLAPSIVGLMHITAWETLATVINNLVADRLAGDESRLVNRADAALTPRVLSQRKSTSKNVQFIIHQAQAMERYRNLQRRLVMNCINGDGNVPADLVSRGLWDDFLEVCNVLHVKPQYVALDSDERQLVREVVEQAAAAGTGTRAPSTITAIQEVAMHEPPVHAVSSHVQRGWTPPDRGGGTQPRAVSAATPPDSESTALPATRERVLTPLEQSRDGTQPTNRDRDGPRVTGAWFLADDPIEQQGWQWCGQGLSRAQRIALVEQQTRSGAFLRAPRGHSHRFVDVLPEILLELVMMEGLQVWAARQGTPPPSPPRMRTPPPEDKDCAPPPTSPRPQPNHLRPRGPWFYRDDHIHLLGWEWYGEGLTRNQRVALLQSQARRGTFLRAQRDYSGRYVDVLPEVLLDLILEGDVQGWAARPQTPPPSPTRVRTPPPEHPRALTAIEQHRGGTQSSNEDKDGPSNNTGAAYRPSWARHAARELQGDDAAYRPSWAASPHGRATMQPAATQARDVTPLATIQRPRRRRRNAAQVYEPMGSTPTGEHEAGKAHALALRLANDRTEGCITAPLHALTELAKAINAAKADGRNPRTKGKDDLAYRRFQTFAALNGFDAELKTQWHRQFPEREAVKLAGFLLFLSHRMRPRSVSDNACKPMSIYQNYLALRRHFKQHDVDLGPSSTVRSVLRGLIERFKRREGVERLRAHQAEPITPDMVATMIAAARKGATIKRKRWHIAEHDCFVTLAWAVVNLYCGTRKAESVRLPGDLDEDDWFTMSSLMWHIRGKVVRAPTMEQLDALTPQDYAMLAPKGSKCDTWGTAHGTEPIILPFRNDKLNAALWLREVERIRAGCDRRTTALFGNTQGEPYTAAAFHELVKTAITHSFGAAAAAIFTPHSWRVWVSTALRAKNASNRVQLMMLRWLNPDSIKIYARASVNEKIFWVDEISKVDSLSAQRTTAYDAMAGSDTLLEWSAALDGGRRGTESDDAFDRRAAEVAPSDKPPLSAGSRLSVYWTEMDAWYDATHLSTRRVLSDEGDYIYESHVEYDAVGAWKKTKIWHRLHDELWETADANAQEDG